jgi:hypothetical protein
LDYNALKDRDGYQGAYQELPLQSQPARPESATDAYNE